MNWTDLRNGDCLSLMKMLLDESVDAIICDPPYGTTQCKWDSIIPFDLMWNELNRIIKPNGAIVLFGSQPFTSKLIVSNIKNYKHKWIWNKKQSGSFINAKFMPLQIDEDIIIFANGRVNYYPIMRKGKMRKRGGAKETNNAIGLNGLKEGYSNYSDLYYPINIYELANPRKKKFHQAEKPIELMEYLIKTYTNENETVLDFTMGSGTTGVACVNLNRNFIGIELDENYFNIAEMRIKQSAKAKF